MPPAAPRLKRTFTLFDGPAPTDSTVVPLPEIDTYVRAQLFVLTVSEVPSEQMNDCGPEPTQIYVTEGAELGDGTSIGHTRELWRYATHKELYHPQWIELDLLGPSASLIIYRPYDGPRSSPVPYRVTAALTVF